MVRSELTHEQDIALVHVPNDQESMERLKRMVAELMVKRGQRHD